MASTFDVLIIGEDAPSLAAAAIASASGAATALAPTGGPSPAGPSVCAIPNFVWRRLDLQEFGLEIEPVSARITLFADGRRMTTRAGLAETVGDLRDVDHDAAALWPAVIDDMRSLEEAGGALGVSAAGPNALFHVDTLRALGDLARLAGSGEELIGDYVNGGPLKTHINAHALAPFGLGGDETGSGAAMPEFFGEHAWRVRAKSGARSIVGALRKACERHGVAMLPKGVERAGADGAKHNYAMLEGGEKVRMRRIFFASPEAAGAAGYLPALGDAPANSARAVMRIKLREPMEPPAGDARALFQIIDDDGDLKDARRAALEGRIAEHPPVEFEFTDKGDIVVRTAYIPKRLQAEGEWRDWTGQDRKHLEATLLNRLASRMDGLHGHVRKTELKMIYRSDTDIDKFAGARNIIYQPRRHNAIAAAIALIDEALAHD